MPPTRKVREFKGFRAEDAWLLEAWEGRSFLADGWIHLPGMYSGGTSFLQMLLGTLYGLLDGFIGGLVLGWLYSLFSGNSSPA